MAASDILWSLKITFIEFNVICLRNLKFAECRKSDVFPSEYLFYCHLSCAAHGSHTTRPTLGVPLWKALEEKFHSPKGPNVKYLPEMQFYYRHDSLYSAMTFHNTINEFPITCMFCFTVSHDKLHTYRNKLENVCILQHWYIFLSLHPGHFSVAIPFNPQGPQFLLCS
jgi:hypothetical protein